MTWNADTKYDPNKYHRKSIRLKGYDYTKAGAYYVTIVAYQRECLFGEIMNGEMLLNEFGNIANECWCSIPEHFPHVELGAYVVMPNHIHGIIVINDPVYPVGATHASPLRDTSKPHGPIPGSLGAIVGSFKSAVTRRIRGESDIYGVWQRNYFEHIIRNDVDFQRITEYIKFNPKNWDNDDENR